MAIFMQIYALQTDLHGIKLNYILGRKQSDGVIYTSFSKCSFFRRNIDKVRSNPFQISTRHPIPELYRGGKSGDIQCPPPQQMADNVQKKSTNIRYSITLLVQHLNG